MIGPTWLAAIVGVILLAVAVVALVRLIASVRAHRTADFEIDVHNVVMGVSMAGMLIPSLLIVTVGPSTIAWLVVWILITLWFAVSVAQDARRHTSAGTPGGHHVPHLVMSAAMVYMFGVMLVPAGGGHAGMSGMSGMSAGSGLVPLATLDYAFVIFMIGYAVLVVDRLPAIAATRTGALQAAGPPAATAPMGATATPVAPTTGAVINIVMALGMGYMLTMMFA